MIKGRVKKGIWLHHFPESEGEVRSIVSRLAEYGFDLIIPCVKNPDGYLDYQSSVGNVRPVFQDFDPLRLMTEEARPLKIEVHPWICVFPEGEGSRLLEQNPGYAARMRPGPKAIKGEYGITWACSSRQEVHEYELSLYRELLAQYPVSGVHLDYIRYCSRFAGVESCYCDYCRESFGEASGYGGEILDLERGHPYWWQWVRWRSERITSFVAALRGIADSFQKEVSAAVFPDYPNCVEEVGQNWGVWGRLGLVDLLIPMNYSQSPEAVAAWTASHLLHSSRVKTRKTGKTRKTKKTRLWEGIRTFEATQPENLRSILSELAAGQVEGVVLFEYNLFSDEFLSIVNAVLS